jgi:hypothetical protein
MGEVRLDDGKIEPLGAEGVEVSYFKAWPLNAISERACQCCLFAQILVPTGRSSGGCRMRVVSTGSNLLVKENCDALC